jgi:alkylation response protein AidB-like acyl-CoA dehydrogenase
MACKLVRSRPQDPTVPYVLGEMQNHLTTAQMALREMIGVTDDFDFEPVTENTNAILIRKTIATKAAIAAVDKAMEAVGGASLFRSRGLESRFRDVRAGPFHPLNEKRQTLFTGRLSLGLEPVE